MKILITTGETPILHGLGSGELNRLAGSETPVCVLASPLSAEAASGLQQQGVRIVSLAEIMRKHPLVSPPSFSDILSRSETFPDPALLSSYYQGKKVLVTGGEGYIGSALVEALLKFPAEKVIAFGHNENALYTLHLKYGEDPRFSYALGDIRDEEKVRRTLLHHSPQVIFHAAAHKHVPILETYPEEAVKTNILGTRKLASLAGEMGIESFVMISTDKAVNPASALGASKRIAEKICLSLDALPSSTRYCSVRFGNVFGSTGSVVPTFLQQISEGLPLTLTDQNMMRYFMSVAEAAHLVLLAGCAEGSLFNLDMGRPVSLVDIVDKIFHYCGMGPHERKIKIIGNRGGEKFSEELVHSFESVQKSKHAKLITLKDHSPLWNEKEIAKLCAEFSDAASFGGREDIFRLFDKYITRYAEVQR